MANQNIIELEPLNTACEEFFAGKYILADVKIASILKFIEQDTKVNNIVSSCCADYDFDEHLNTCLEETDNGHLLHMPTEEKSIIAFVYNLLCAFNNKTIDIYRFVSKFFSTADDNINEAFGAFANSVVRPFKDAINSLYSKRHIIVDTDDYQINYYNKIKATIRLIMNDVDNFKLKMNEKEEFTMLLNSLFIASEKNDKKLVFSLMIAIDYFSRYHKRTRIAYKSLEECFGY